MDSQPTPLTQTFDFILEIDQLKNVLRNSLITSGERRENDAEHSWHLAMMIVVLQDKFPQNVDLLKCIKMALIHDIVEIDAGDVCVFDTEARKAKEIEEAKAADRIFNLLPSPLAAELKNLWEEYEERKTIEARFVKIVDVIQPVLMNYKNNGHTWKIHNVTFERVLALHTVWKEDWPELFDFLLGILKECEDKNYFWSPQ